MMVKKQRASASPCRIAAIISKNSISISGDKTLGFVPLYKNLIAATISFGIPYALKIFNIFSLCMLSKAFLISMNTAASRFLSLILSSLLMFSELQICAVVDLSGLNPFWLGCKYGLTFG